MEISPVISARMLSAAAVLRFAWDLEAFTASDAMADTGLTRSTVIGLCDELIERGWLVELADARVHGSHYRKGRPARRYAFAAHRAAVVGVDAGVHTVTTQVCDLRGARLAHVRDDLVGDSPTAEERITAIDSSVEHALSTAGLTRADVECVVVGVPAPTDAQGVSPAGSDGFWRKMNPDLCAHFDSQGLTALVENDANLAAIAEGAMGDGVGIDSFITILAGERIGAGFVVDGRLLRGARGGAGESHPLDQIAGVGNADGIGALAREWALEARASGKLPSTSALMKLAEDEVTAMAVFQLAEKGDPTASEILGRLAERLARISAVLSGFLDVDRIIVAGGIAESLGPLLERASAQLRDLSHLQPPVLIASGLGTEVVTLGAIRRGITWVKEGLPSLISESPLGSRAPDQGTHTATG